MKIRSLAPLAIACLALLMPRLIPFGGVFGGGIAIAKPACDSKNINHPCSGPSACKFLVTVEETTNSALRHYVAGEKVLDCKQFSLPGQNCVGKANEADDYCDD